METVWFGYLTGALFYLAAVVCYYDPFKTEPVRWKRYILAIVAFLMGWFATAYPEKVTAEFYRVFNLNTLVDEVITPRTISDYDCDDVAEQLKLEEFQNVFGRVMTVLYVRESAEIERTEKELWCRVTGVTSDNTETIITAGFEEVDGEFYIFAQQESEQSRY